ncbi:MULTISPECIES: CopD family protein [Cycloclasticus]|jgi:uncharacterized membrane protein|uniref:Integral membrane protein n=1 Tax=Cycloclasticus zancles 78-ME TaxID=1198232 RepID=S5T5C2_9GAMM|nr:MULTISPECIES: CopD family protein [Cycloclasticus]AFT68039.1 hypothetical protein Q91_2006 [Cycloclasticus sp. P1]AGS38759.1 Integral membrane protein [Cycloclasticus zancles 78-ME]
MISLAISLHALSSVIWVGGMFFAYLVLRPSIATQLDSPQQLSLWSTVFAKFFPWVWVCVVLLLGTGFWLIFNKFGGMKYVAPYVHLMMSMGIIMVLIFMHIFFAPTRKLKRAVTEQNWEGAAKSLGQIRLLIAINLIIGLSVIVIATAGRYMVG